jgi:N-acetylmuramoyl-L-alanine amidase
MKRKISQIIIHCAATPNLKPIKASAIDAMHVMRGFKRHRDAISRFNPSMKAIGYHYVIETDGNIAFGRDLEEIGAHVQGSNANSIGVCLIGTDQFTDAQWASLKQLIITIATKLYGKPTATIQNSLATLKQMNVSIKGHRDYSPDKDGDGIIERNEWLKICPGFSLSDWLKGLS